MRKLTVEVVVKCDDGRGCAVAGVGPRVLVLRGVDPIEGTSDALIAAGWSSANVRDVCPRCVAAAAGAP